MPQSSDDFIVLIGDVPNDPPPPDAYFDDELGVWLTPERPPSPPTDHSTCGGCMGCHMCPSCGRLEGEGHSRTCPDG